MATEGPDIYTWAGSAPWQLARLALDSSSRVFFWGPPGIGKSYLTLTTGRPSFQVLKVKGVKFSRLNTYSFHDATEFLRAFTQHAGINLTIEVVNGEDSHHIIEAMFKATAKALDMATQRDIRVKGIPSTKGSL